MELGVGQEVAEQLAEDERVGEHLQVARYVDRHRRGPGEEVAHRLVDRVSEDDRVEADLEATLFELGELEEPGGQELDALGLVGQALQRAGDVGRTGTAGFERQRAGHDRDRTDRTPQLVGGPRHERRPRLVHLAQGLHLASTLHEPPHVEDDAFEEREACRVGRVGVVGIELQRGPDAVTQRNGDDHQALKSAGRGRSGPLAATGAVHRRDQGLARDHDRLGAVVLDGPSAPVRGAAKGVEAVPAQARPHVDRDQRLGIFLLDQHRVAEGPTRLLADRIDRPTEHGGGLLGVVGQRVQVVEHPPHRDFGQQFGFHAPPPGDVPADGLDGQDAPLTIHDAGRALLENPHPAVAVDEADHQRFVGVPQPVVERHELGLLLGIGGQVGQELGIAVEGAGWVAEELLR